MYKPGSVTHIVACRIAYSRIQPFIYLKSPLQLYAPDYTAGRLFPFILRYKSRA